MSGKSKNFKELQPNVQSFFQNENFFNTTILAKIYATNFSVGVKQHTTGKFQFQFLKSFSLALIKFSFWEEEWAFGYKSMKIWDLLNIS